LRAKIVAIVKTKMQLVLGKNTLEMNEMTLALKFTVENLERKFEETTHTQKYGKTY